jgi:hypothetical protein
LSLASRAYPAEGAGQLVLRLLLVAFPGYRASGIIQTGLQSRSAPITRASLPC